MSLDDLFRHQCQHPHNAPSGYSYVCTICRRLWVRMETPSGWMSEHDDRDFEIIGVTVRYNDGTRASFPG